MLTLIISLLRFLISSQKASHFFHAQVGRSIGLFRDHVWTSPCQHNRVGGDAVVITVAESRDGWLGIDLTLTLDRNVRVSRSSSHLWRGYGGRGCSRRTNRAVGSGSSRLVNSRRGGTGSSVVEAGGEGAR
jgi:hypothetical protein